jgi:hypothetical protein
MSETNNDIIPRIFPDQPEKPEAPAMPPALPFKPAAEPDGAQAARDRAFDAEYEWNGKKLHGFSLDRETLFLEKRTAMGAGDLVAAARDFDGFQADAFRILFICAHTKDQLGALRRDALLFQDAVDEWAAANITKATRSKAINQAINMLADARATEHEPVPAGEKDESGN